MKKLRFIYGIIISILLITIFEFDRRKNNDLFSPLCIFSVMQFLMYVPSIMFATVEYDQTLNEITLFPVFIFQLLFILSVLFGYSIIRISKNKNNQMKKCNKYHKIPKLSLIFFIYSLGFAAKIYTMFRSGGILAIINNPAEAYLSLTSGSGYFEIMKYFVYISVILIIYRASKTKSKFELLIIFIMIVGYIFLDLIYSRRSITFTFAIIVVFSWNYFFKKIKIRELIRPKLLILISLIAIMIVVLPVIRSGGFEEQANELNEISISEGIQDIATRFSMVGRDVFVYRYFNFSNYWLGRSYLNLPVSFIPSQIWSEKPAVDEGVYLTNLIYGNDVSPNDSFRSLVYKISIPFTTQGLLYANFGILGIIMGGMLMGYIYKCSYNKINTHGSVFNYLIYRMVIFEFGLTVMTLTNVVIELVIIKTTSLFFKKSRQIKIRSNEN